MYKIFMKTTFR